MSFLVIGGAFVVALLALVALVFILRQEEAQPTTPAKPAATAEKTAPPAPATAPAKVQTQAQEPVTQTLPVKMESQFPTHNDDQHLSISDGQFHEFVVELHTLHEQAQELEHRLSILTEMVGRIQRSPNGRISVEEETYHSQDVPSANTK